MNDPTLRDRYNAAYIVMGGTGFLCFVLHFFLFWSVYFWLPASFLGLMSLGLMVKREFRENLVILSLVVLVWLFTTAIPLLMLILGNDFYRGILR